MHVLQKTIEELFIIAGHPNKEAGFFIGYIQDFLQKPGNDISVFPKLWSRKYNTLYIQYLSVLLPLLDSPKHTRRYGHTLICVKGSATKQNLMFSSKASPTAAGIQTLSYLNAPKTRVVAGGDLTALEAHLIYNHDTLFAFHTEPMVERVTTQFKNYKVIIIPEEPNGGFI